METPQIDAVQMIRGIRDAHAETLRNATPEERVRFYREKARRLHAEVEQRQGKSRLSGAAGTAHGIQTAGRS
jgi:hypothetical protein